MWPLPNRRKPQRPFPLEAAQAASLPPERENAQTSQRDEVASLLTLEQETRDRREGARRHHRRLRCCAMYLPLVMTLEGGYYFRRQRHMHIKVNLVNILLLCFRFSLLLCQGSPNFSVVVK